MTGPSDLKACRRGAEWALAAAAAQELGLFQGLAEGALGARDLADALGLDPRGTRILLGVLVELGLVRREPEGYRLTGQGRARFVDPDAPDFEAAAMRQWRANIRRWALQLDHAVRTGEPPEGPPAAAGAEVQDDETEEEALRRFMAAMADKPAALVDGAVDACRDRLREAGIDPAGARSLDLGGGPGTFARRFAAWGGEAVLAERPRVVEMVREAYGLDRVPRLELWAGDFLEGLPQGPFDLVLLSNITHIYDAETNARLLVRVRQAMRPGGILAILDFVRGASEFASLFAITMLLQTERGDTYGRGDYERWLGAGGFTRTRMVRLDPDRHLITATAPARTRDERPG